MTRLTAPTTRLRAARRHRPLAVVLAGAMLLGGCDDGGSTGEDTTQSADTKAPDTASQRDTSMRPDLGDALDVADVTPPSSGMCPALEPRAVIEPVHTVGDGTAASCDAAALRAGIDAINAADGGTLKFACGGAHTIEIDAPLILDTTADPDGGPTVLIDGGGEVTISGGGTTRILDLDHYTRLVVQRITLRDGFVAQEADGDPPNSGAAIRHPWFGSLVAIDVRFVNNHCESRDGEIGGGAVFAGGLSEAVFSGCTFVDNSASNGGGLLNRGSTLTLIDSVFRGNGALGVGDGQFGNGGGVYIDGMNDDPAGDLTVCGTVFERNSATQHGSGMFAFFYEGSSSTIEHSVFDGNVFTEPGEGSGALYHQAVHMDLRSTTLANHTSGEHAGGLFVGSGSSATITNCTFANNRVPGNGAGLFDGASPIEIVNSTFTGNHADYGPAIFKGQNATVGVRNTIFANNTTDNQFSATSCHEALDDMGGNIQWPETKDSGNPDQPCVEGILFADPLLQALADNGGIGETAALGTGSPAIGLGVDCPPTDQRGLPRDAPCDAGAYEVQP